MPKTAPFCIEQAVQSFSSQSDFAWPVSHPEIFLHVSAFEKRFMDGLLTIESPELRDCLAVGGIYFLREGAMLTEAALTAQQLRNKGMRFIDPPAVYRFFLEKEAGFLPWDGSRNPFLTLKDPLSLYLLREFKATWRVQGVRAFGSWLMPHRFLLGETPLTASYLAMHPEERIRYRFPASLVRHLPRTSPPTSRGIEVAQLAARIAGSDSGLEPDFSALLTESLTRAARSIFPFVDADLSAMTKLGRLPEKILAGSGGSYASRLVGYEVVRRGGEVDRFEHGAIPSVLTEVNDHLSSLELPPSSCFYMSTRQYARIAITNGAIARNAGPRPVRIEGLEGDPSFRAAYHGKKTVQGARKTLLYVPTLYRGHKQYTFPLLPDMLYLDWQLRLSQFLASLGHELICQPHPEGILGGPHHPLAPFRLPGKPIFEEIMAQADVYLFDYFSSQTFLRALCTDRKVIFFDLTGGLKMVPQVADAFARRVAILRPPVDENNRFLVDKERIAQAIEAEGCDDGAFFLSLFGGVTHPE